MNGRSAARSLARDLETPVYCVDLRNHGDSPHAEPHTYASMAADVRKFLTDNEIGPSHVIGHSMGAKVAMELALREPKLVSSVIPVDNAPVTARLGASFTRYVEGMQAVEAAKAKTQQQLDQALIPFCNDSAVRQYLLANFKRDSNGIFKCRMSLPILSRSLGCVSEFGTGIEKPFEGPALLIRALRSPFVPDSVLPAMRKFFPNFELCSLDCGHWVVSERPREFVQAVVDFLGDKYR